MSQLIYLTTTTFSLKTVNLYRKIIFCIQTSATYMYDIQYMSVCLHNVNFQCMSVEFITTKGIVLQVSMWQDVMSETEGVHKAQLVKEKQNVLVV